MRKLREVLRLCLDSGLTLRQTKDSQRLGLGLIQKIVSQAETLGLSWKDLSQLNDVELANHFYPQSDNRLAKELEIPDWREVYQ